MIEIAKLFDRIEELCKLNTSVREESFRLTIEGDGLTAEQSGLIACIGEVLQSITPATTPILLVNEEKTSCSDIAIDDTFFGCSWRLVIAKQGLANLKRSQDNEQVFLFFSESGLRAWLETLDPFVRTGTQDPDFDKPTTIRVHGLEKAFGGPCLQVLPFDSQVSAQTTTPILPDHDKVGSTIHISSTGPNIQVSPRGWALTWGNLDTPAAQPLLRLGCLVLGSSLSSDLKYIDGVITSTIRGTKQYSLPLWSTNTDLPWRNLHRSLISAVSWVYSERPETRLHLLMDRLTLDINPGEFLLASLHRHLDLALRQAEDSYRFVILDRKDAYYKEMRELMKDMKDQSDHYASKTRDVVNALLRDFLGVLVFLAFSFVGKFDKDNLHTLLGSQELTLFLRFLAGYLALSFALQIAAHMRDDFLTHREAEKWLDVLRNYTSSQDKCQNFMRPIESRRRSLHQAMVISALLYGTLITAVWFLPEIVQSMLT